jgi:hypothetical protein
MDEVDKVSLNNENEQLIVDASMLLEMQTSCCPYSQKIRTRCTYRESTVRGDQ